MCICVCLCVCMHESMYDYVIMRAYMYIYTHTHAYVPVYRTCPRGMPALKGWTVKGHTAKSAIIYWTHF